MIKQQTKIKKRKRDMKVYNPSTPPPFLSLSVSCGIGTQETALAFL